MMLVTTKQKELKQFNSNGTYIPLKTSKTFLSTFTSWAKIWMSPNTQSNIPRKRKVISPTPSQEDLKRETDIRSRNNYYNPIQFTLAQMESLYRVTCHKLRPSTSATKLCRLGDILNVRQCWNTLESEICKEKIKQNAYYQPPTRRVPFCPDKPGSLYLPRKSKRDALLFRERHKKRPLFATSTIVYNINSPHIPLKLVIPIEDDDDDVPLGTLLSTRSFLL